MSVIHHCFMTFLTEYTTSHQRVKAHHTLTLNHTHNCFMALFDFVQDYPGEPAPKGKIRKVKQSGFTGARDSEWQWHQLGHMQICTLIQTQPRQHPTTQFFYRPDALPATQPTVSKD